MIEFGNDLVTLESDNGTEYRITVVNGGQAVGRISLKRGAAEQSPASLHVEIQEQYRSRHYASNAVYLLTAFAHQEMQIVSLENTLDQSEELARHILEHSGYQMIRETDSTWTYRHEKEVTRDATSYAPGQGERVIYLAGGCFWGTERAFQVLRGVTGTKVGYANGHVKNPSYEEICRNETGFRETVRVTYDPARVSLETVLDAYFIVTDPTQENRQGNDIGSQYQSGVYYRDPEDEGVIRAYFERVKGEYPAFHVECKALESFYEAEEYHQDYLTKIPNGYCHVTRVDLERIRAL